MADALGHITFLLREQECKHEKSPGRNEPPGQGHLIKNPGKLLDIGVTHATWGAADLFHGAVKLFGPHFSDDALPSSDPAEMAVSSGRSVIQAAGRSAINGVKTFVPASDGRVFSMMGK